MPEKKKSNTSITTDLNNRILKWKEDKDFAELVLDTVREGLLVLDSDLRVNHCNESFYHKFKADPKETEGTLLFELGNGQWDIPELHRLLEEILPENKVINDFEIEHNFEGIGHRIMLLNARQIDHLQLILLAIEDVTERKKVLRDLKYLVSILAESEQEERRRISRLLHDELQQMLFVSQMNLKFSYREVDPDTQGVLAQKIEESMVLIDAAIQKTRELTGDLNPFVLKSEHLTDILKWLAKRFKEMHGLKTELIIKDDIQIPDENCRTIILQTVRELLFNVVKHAGTDRATIQVQNAADDYLVLEVIDEGSGFEVDMAGSRLENTQNFGLFNIRERLNLFGGKLEINSGPGKGTHVTIRMQLP